MTNEAFEKEYKKLNDLQKEAVESIDGPVMVVAGPGTGKTQVLALRIGYILKETQSKADSILCLTFTNSGVKAMRERLRKYIGAEASKVKVATFHSFGMEILEQYFTVLGFDEKPKLMDDGESILLYDEVLNNNSWKYLRPRSNSAKYFNDIKSLISLLKKEHKNADEFICEIKLEIKDIENDEASIASRGENKGKLKKEIEKKIEALHRTIEAVNFYALYEKSKQEKNLLDYDDILSSLVSIVEESDEARDFIKENYEYVLIDEHQDSSGVQNDFLEKVWYGVERPNIFVVGDDRQLIYGFGGASLEYFENFKNTFGSAKQITLLENYRSTQNILDSAHDLLESTLSKGKLKSNHTENHPIRLIETYYPRDEIIFSALEIKDRIAKGEDPNQMAILVPKNRQVDATVTVLKDMGIPVSSLHAVDFFDVPEALAFLRILKILSNPGDSVAFGASFFDKLSNIPPLKAHRFIKNNKMREFSLLTIEEERNNLFDNKNEINDWICKLKSWLEYSNTDLHTLIQKIGAEFLLDTAKNHKDLILRIEVIRTMLHLIAFKKEQNPKITLFDLLTFIERLQEYGEGIPLALFMPEHGVKVLTLHGSKGLEFDYVWIAHMNERSFSGGKRDGFSLSKSLEEKAHVRDESVLKRELYVAITRAKRFCTISYSLSSYTGSTQELAHIVANLENNFKKTKAEEAEKIILKQNERAFVDSKEKLEESVDLKDLIKLVAKEYEDRKVSVSLLNNFFECTWKWYFRNLLQLPEPQSESLNFGNIVHGTIDEILKLSKKPIEKELQNIILHQISKSGAGEKEKKEFTRTALSRVQRWVDTRLVEINKKRENEKNVSVSSNDFPNLKIYGKIDLMEFLSEQDVRVTDFKTGTVRKKADIEKMDEEGRMSSYLRQLAMYSYLIQESSGNKLKVSLSRLEFLEAKDLKESFYDRVITDKEIDLLKKDIIDYDDMLKEGGWVKRRCNYNSYGKNTECEYCQMAKIYK